MAGVIYEEVCEAHELNIVHYQLVKEYALLIRNDVVDMLNGGINQL